MQLLFVPQSLIDIHIPQVVFQSQNSTIQCWYDLPACSEDFASFASFRRLLSRTDLSGYTMHGA